MKQHIEGLLDAPIETLEAIPAHQPSARSLVVAFVEPTVHSTLDAVGLQRHLRARLAAYQVPTTSVS